MHDVCQLWRSRKGSVVGLAMDSIATECCCCPPAASRADCEVEIQAAAAGTSSASLLTRVRSKLEAALIVYQCSDVQLPRQYVWIWFLLGFGRIVQFLMQTEGLGSCSDTS
jgi:hypothetical protein